MKSFINLQTNRFIQSTLTTISGFKKGYATVTSCQASLQPLSGEKTNLYNGAMGKTFQMFLDNGETVNEGDRFRDRDTGKNYKVVNGGVSRRVYGSMDYLSVVVQEVD